MRIFYTVFIILIILKLCNVSLAWWQVFIPFDITIIVAFIRTFLEMYIIYKAGLKN